MSKKQENDGESKLLLITLYSQLYGMKNYALKKVDNSKYIIYASKLPNQDKWKIAESDEFVTGSVKMLNGLPLPSTYTTDIVINYHLVMFPSAPRDVVLDSKKIIASREISESELEKILT